MNKMHVKAGAALIALMVAGSPAFADGEVNVYTYREPALIEPIFAEFTKESGIKVNVIFAKDGLEQKILAEGANSPADLLLTVDIARLQEAEDIGITQPVTSDALTQAIPESLRDPDGNWYALTMRARVVYASKERVKDTAITYEDLADPRWKGRICLRSGQHIYNNALFAAYLARHGEAETETWITGIKNNLAKKPSGGDRDVAKDISAGVCDIGLGNTYYVGLMTNGSDEQKGWVNAIKVILPAFKDGGTHVNISGAAIARYAPNRDNAVKLLEWLAGNRAQQLYANANYEYPVRAGIAPAPIVAGFGELKPDSMPMAEIARNKKKAAEIVDKVAFDEGPGT
jgi:iron(III) transport system substrate-binding protein